MCRDAGRARYGREVCFFTGDDCKKERGTKGLTFRQMEALRLWQAAQTQWRVGFGGATGLDYAGVAALADVLEVDFPWVFDLVQRLEVDQLTTWRKEAEARSKK